MLPTCTNTPGWMPPSGTFVPRVHRRFIAAEMRTTLDIAERHRCIPLRSQRGWADGFDLCRGWRKPGRRCRCPRCATSWWCWDRDDPPGAATTSRYTASPRRILDFRPPVLPETLTPNRRQPAGMLATIASDPEAGTAAQTSRHIATRTEKTGWRPLRVDRAKTHHRQRFHRQPCWCWWCCHRRYGQQGPVAAGAGNRQPAGFSAGRQLEKLGQHVRTQRRCSLTVARACRPVAGRQEAGFRSADEPAAVRAAADCGARCRQHRLALELTVEHCKAAQGHSAKRCTTCRTPASETGRGGPQWRMWCAAFERLHPAPAGRHAGQMRPPTWPGGGY